MPITQLTNGISSDRKIEQFQPPYGFLSSVIVQPNFDECVINYSANQRSQKSSSNLICKLVLIGDVAVGKSSLATRLCHNTFDRNYKATIGVDFEVEKFSVLGVPISLQIWDTAGQERFKCIAAAYYRGAHVIVGVFDMTDLTTLNSAEKWINESLQTTAIDHPLIFLVGTKRDLITDDRTFVRIESLAKTLAEKLNAEFWPVSSLTGHQVQEFFRRIACVSYQMLVKQQLNPSSHTREKTVTKTQLAVNLSSHRNSSATKQTNENCCSTG